MKFACPRPALNCLQAYAGQPKSYSRCCAKGACIGQVATLKTNISDKIPKTWIEFLFFIRLSSFLWIRRWLAANSLKQSQYDTVWNFSGPRWGSVELEGTLFSALEY